ncbi:MAG: hypothetical protein ABJ275_10135 [Maricaulaceae bacterium]
MITSATAQQAQEDDSRSLLTPLDGTSLEAAFSGKTMDGIYKIPRERTGTNQFTESFNADGTADYFEGPIVDTGEWRVRDRLICFRYDGALSGGVSCFNVYRTGTCLYSYNPANVGKDGYPYDENLWSVKTVTRGGISSCDDLVS